MKPEWPGFHGDWQKTAGQSVSTNGRRHIYQLMVGPTPVFIMSPPISPDTDIMSHRPRLVGHVTEWTPRKELAGWGRGDLCHWASDRLMLLWSEIVIYHVVYTVTWRVYHRVLKLQNINSELRFWTLLCRFASYRNDKHKTRSTTSHLICFSCIQGSIRYALYIGCKDHIIWLI